MDVHCIWVTKVESRCSRNARQYGVCRQHWRSFHAGMTAPDLAHLKPCLEARLRTDCTSLVLGYLEIGRDGLERTIKRYLELSVALRNKPKPAGASLIQHSANLVVALYSLIAHEGQQLCWEQPDFHRVVLTKADELLPKFEKLDQKAAVLSTLQTIRDWPVKRV